MAVASTAWFLLVISGSTVTPNHGFPTRQICEDGKSLLLTGRTVADEAKHQADMVAAEQKRQDYFAAKYPPRKPKTKEEFKMVAQMKNQSSSSPLLTFSGGSIYCVGGDDNPIPYAMADGLIHFMRDPCIIANLTFYGEPQKRAYCVPEYGQ